VGEAAALALAGFTGCLGAAGGVRKENGKKMVQTDDAATAYGPREEERMVVLISNDAVIFYFTKGN
jgi:hypothetical protein